MNINQHELLNTPVKKSCKNSENQREKRCHRYSPGTKNSPTPKKLKGKRPPGQTTQLFEPGFPFEFDDDLFSQGNSKMEVSKI